MFRPNSPTDVQNATFRMKKLLVRTKTIQILIFSACGNGTDWEVFCASFVVQTKAGNCFNLLIREIFCANLPVQSSTGKCLCKSCRTKSFWAVLRARVSLDDPYKISNAPGCRWRQTKTVVKLHKQEMKTRKASQLQGHFGSVLCWKYLRALRLKFMSASLTFTGRLCECAGAFFFYNFSAARKN